MSFWHKKALQDMDQQEWESLCDGCGLCCLHKIEDEDSGEVTYSAISCKLYDLEAKTCGDYANRQKKVPDCIQLTVETLAQCSWLPESCGYVRIAKGLDLPDWHPLKTGVPNSTHQAGMVMGSWAKRALPRLRPEQHLLHWYDPKRPFNEQSPPSLIDRFRKKL